MISILHHIAKIRQSIPQDVSMVCVSKFHPIESILQAYEAGERDFGESRVQELLLKQQALPKDIRWHFIGHLQTNKVKQIVPFIHLIHSVDSIRLLETINREAEKIQHPVKVLLEVHVAREDSKSGFTPNELEQLAIHNPNLIVDYPWVEICGIMGMATNTNDEQEIRRCFQTIKHLSDTLHFAYPPVIHPSSTRKNTNKIVSMGMSDDYLIAIEEGSNMVRIGSAIFGEREYLTT